MGADLIFSSNPDYTSSSCKANSFSQPALLCQVAMDKQPLRAGTTLILADFSAPVALPSWVMSSAAQWLWFIQVTGTHDSPTTERPADPSAILIFVTKLPQPWVISVYSCFISVSCKPDYIHLPLQGWVTSVIKMRGKNFLSSNSAS